MLEAFARCQIRPTALTSDHLADARRSLNLALQSWANKGLLLFTLEQNTIQLVQGQAAYILPPEVVSIADAYYSTIIGTGQGPDWDAPLYNPSQPIVTNDPQVVITQSQDRWLQPRGHADYAMIPNKQMEGYRQLSTGSSGLGRRTSLSRRSGRCRQSPIRRAAVTYFAVRQIQDAGLQNGETPDAPTRYLDALSAELAWRLARKYAPALIGGSGAGGLLDDRDESWEAAIAEDVDKGAPISIGGELFRYWNV